MGQARNLSNSLMILAGILSLVLIVLWCTVGDDDDDGSSALSFSFTNTDGAAERPHYRPSLRDDNHNTNKTLHHGKKHSSSLPWTTRAPVAASGSRPRAHLIMPTVSPTTTSPTEATVLPTTASPTIQQDNTQNNKASSSSLSQNDFRFCRKARIVPNDQTAQQLQKQQQATPMAYPNSTHELDIWYQCQGKDYNQFATQLATFVQSHAAAKLKQQPGSLWGRRPTALPDGKTILVLGNSHVRQVATAWICQYHDQIAVMDYYGDDMDPYMVLRVVFQNQAVLYLVANSYVPYTTTWPNALAQQLQLENVRALVDTMDAVILGMFNRCGGTGQSNFAIHMAALASNRTDLQACMANIPPHVNNNNSIGPNITAVAQVFAQQPLLYIPMFSLSRSAQMESTLQQVHALQQQQEQQQEEEEEAPQTNRPVQTDALHVRQYIDLLQNECGSNNRLEVSKCRNNDRAKENMHRCMGARGGHPDLIAWDAAEFVFQALASPNNNDKVAE